jgi:hypothetical protein
MMEDTIIARLPKNGREELRISLTEFHDKPLVAARVYFRPESGGEMRPGKSGLNLRVSMLPDLIAALQQAESEARRLGQFDDKAAA